MSIFYYLSVENYDEPMTKMMEMIKGLRDENIIRYDYNDNQFMAQLSSRNTVTSRSNGRLETDKFHPLLMHF